MTAAKTLPDTWVCCNCVGCRKVLSGRACAASLTLMSGRARRNYPPLLAGRVLGRPYCAACLADALLAGQVVDGEEVSAS